MRRMKRGRDEERRGVDPVGDVGARGRDDEAAERGADRPRQVLAGAEARVGRREIGRGDEIGKPGVRGRPEEPRREAGCGSEHHDRLGAVRERERREDAEPREVGDDHDPAARQPVDQRSEQQADCHGGQEVCDEQRAHPLRGARPVVDVDRERDDGDPRPEPGRERRSEERPEARVSAQQAGLAMSRGA